MRVVDPGVVGVRRARHGGRLTPELTQDLARLAAVGLAEACCIAVPAGLALTGRLSTEWARSVIHATCGLGIFVVPALSHPWLAVLGAGLAALLLSKPTAESPMARWLYGAIAEAEEVSLGYLEGPFVYAVAIAALGAWIAVDADAAPFALSIATVMMYADPAAGVVGRRWGRHAISVPWVGSKRSVEGSLTFLVVSTALAWGLLTALAAPPLAGLDVLSSALLLAAIATVMELASPSKVDDLLVPLGTMAAVVLLRAG